MSERHRKKHNTHETTDAYAEGWDARERALPNEIVKNPYKSEIATIAEQKLNRSVRQIDVRNRDAKLWDQGWLDFEEELARPV